MQRRSPRTPRPWVRRFAPLLAAVLLVLGAGVGFAQLDFPRRDELPLGDLIEIVLVAEQNQLLAIDANGGTPTIKLRLQERVLWTDTRGLLGVVRTDQRLLAVATGSASWQEVEYERDEGHDVWVQLGDRVALAQTPKRLLGFIGTSSRFAEARLGPREKVRGTSVGANVAVAVTGRRSLGLSPDAGGFFAERMQLREEIESIEARDNLATVRTDTRILVFRAPTGSWEERRP